MSFLVDLNFSRNLAFTSTTVLLGFRIREGRERQSKILFFQMLGVFIFGFAPRYDGKFTPASRRSGWQQF